MNEVLYEKLEVEFAKHRIEDEVEDVLLEMAEALSEKQVLNQEIKASLKLGHLKLEACGICEKDGEDPDDVSVYIKTLTVGTRVFPVEDYFL